MYDLPERVIPAEVLRAPAPDEEESNRRLLDMSIVALGVATVKDLADYFRIKVPQARPRIRELVEDGTKVKKGQVVIDLDDSGLQDQLKTQQNTVETARAPPC